MKISLSAIQVQLFLLAILIYATFGQPTPEKLGVVEIIIAVSLVLSIGIFNFIGAITFRPLFEKHRDNFEKLASITLGFLFFVPAIIGLLSGHSLTLIIRDLVPLMYSFLPLFLYHKLSRSDTSRLYGVCVVAGVILAIRFLIISGFSWELLGKFGFYDNNMYLSISPFILFATLFLFLDFFEVKGLIKKSVFAFYSILCAGTMLATSQRASIGAGLLFIFAYILQKAKKNLSYLVLGAIVFTLIYFSFDDHIMTSFNMLMEKTRAVGSNSRIAEFGAAIGESKDSIFNTLFGNGWGYKFWSPAVADTKIGFTHCMFSYFFLKTGFVGTVLYTTYLLSIFTKIFYKNKDLNYISYACLAPLLIAMTLYTGYKYFDFGCLLLVLLMTKHIPLSISAKRQEIIERFSAGGIDNSKLDSLLIMQRVMNISHTTLLIDGAKTLTHRQEQTINKLVKRRLIGEPIARMDNVKEFWGLEFSLNRDTLVPRPDSETIIEAILDNYSKLECVHNSTPPLGRSQNSVRVLVEGQEDINQEKPLHSSQLRSASLLPADSSPREELKPIRILDLGTGSGCLLLATLLEFTNATGVGVDLSANVVKKAKENANNLGLKDRCKFIKSNWFENVNGKFDVIISNPPYVKKDEKLSKEVSEYDPHLALFAKNKGLQCYEDISHNIKGYLKPNGKVFLEIGVGQKQKVIDIMTKAGLLYESQKKDLGGKIRCLVFRRK